MILFSEKELALTKQRVRVPGGEIFLVEVPCPSEGWSPEERTRNIGKIGDDGTPIWRIKPPRPFDDDDSFMDLRVEDGLVVAGRWRGDVVCINASNGLAEKIRWEK